MPQTFKIYGLIDPRSCELYYVGQTRRALHDRMDEHFYESSDTLVSKKNQAIIKSGDHPHIILLDTAQDEESAFHKELYWIHFWKAEGKSLKNREAQSWFRKRYDETFSGKPPTFAGQSKRSASAKFPARQAKPPTGGIPPLKAETYKEAQAKAPGMDIHALEKRWRNSNKGKKLDYPDRAFIGWCKAVVGQKKS